MTTTGDTPDDSLAERIGRLEQRLDGDAWAGRPALRGTLPRAVVRDVLPTAAETFRFAFITIRGAVGAADVTYQCLKDAAEAYAWEIVATG